VFAEASRSTSKSTSSGVRVSAPGELKIIAAILEPPVIEKILSHLG
jgi:hypothetical protein